MTAQASIVVFDGAASPASHTFLAQSVVKDAKLDEVVAIYREGVTSVPVYAQGVITLKLKRLPSGVWRANTRIEIPVMESVSGQNAAGYTAAPKVAYVNTIESTGFFHERSSIAERRLVKQILTNVSNNVSTTVAAATSGPFDELYSLLTPPG